MPIRYLKPKKEWLKEFQDGEYCLILDEEGDKIWLLRRYRGNAQCCSTERALQMCDILEVTADEQLLVWPYVEEQQVLRRQLAEAYQLQESLERHAPDVLPVVNLLVDFASEPAFKEQIGRLGEKLNQSLQERIRAAKEEIEKLSRRLEETDHPHLNGIAEVLRRAREWDLLPAVDSPTEETNPS